MMTSKPPAPPPPSPVFYLNPGEAVTYTLFKSNNLVVGTARGTIIFYCAKDWRKVGDIKAFNQGGLLWMDVIDSSIDANASSDVILVCQGRFDGVKLFRPANHSSWSAWEEVASFAIPHSGFCGGFVKLFDKDLVTVVPSDQSKLVVAKLVNTFIRPVVSMVRKDSGTVMCVKEWDKGMVVAGYESGEVLVWDWSNNNLIKVVTLVHFVGTIMSLDWDMEKQLGLVVGAEDKVVVFNKELDAITKREVTNKGLGEVKIRPDRKIVVCGGWDGRLRIFSWVKPDKLKPLAVLKFHTETVESVTFSDVALEGGRLCGKKVLVAGGKDGKVSLWDIY